MFSRRWLLIFAGLAMVLGFFVWRQQSTKLVEPNLVDSPSPLARLLAELTPTPPPSINLLFGGDLMFDRHIRQYMETNGVDFILSPMTETFSLYDAVIANLEGPVTAFPSRSVGSAVGSTNNFIFTFDPNIVPMLKRNNLTIVNLGNNHILNFGHDGVKQTKQFLNEGEIEFFGNTSLETDSTGRILIKDFGETSLAFVNYNQFVNQGFEAALTDVAEADNQADLVIVMSHWGNEYEPIAGQVVQNWAHQLIGAGADLIIGGHPHVVQQMEEYQGKRIYYSLGNFVFDQYFEPAVQQGLLVGVEITPDLNLSFSELPIQIDRNGQTRLTPQ